MARTVFVAKERSAGETRVAASPETVKKMAGLGLEIVIERGAGEGSKLPDTEFEKAGARIGSATDAANADVVLKVRRPEAEELSGYKSGAVVIAIMDPYGNDEAIRQMADRGVTAFAMELMPRITRAQSMDVLSSQANLAGYQAVIDAAYEFDRAMPMMMTAAGTVPAARVFVMGAGVAGLQAIATAKRLGAAVSATDVRPASKEQVASLGGKFIAVEDEEFKAAETAGGYAKEMSKEYQAKQAALVADHIAKQDIVITTALIPGRPAPRLVTRDMLASMRPGSIVVDLAVERGGNVEGSKAGEVVDVEGVKVVGHTNVSGRIAASASLLYAKNLLTFLQTMVKDGELAINFDDELIKATALTHGGNPVHPNFGGSAPAAPKTVEPAGEGAEADAETKGDA
jgi:NAD(P) transhydrogenase subunit alpha